MTGLLPAQPQTLAALQAMQATILAECLVGGLSPFAALSAADATRYGVSRAVFVGQPKDFADAYLPQCQIWLPEHAEVVTLTGYTGRATAELVALVRVYVEMQRDWWAGEQQIYAIRDALWPVLLRHARLGGGVPSVLDGQAQAGRGLCYEQLGGTVYRCYEARWMVRQHWMISGGRGL